MTPIRNWLDAWRRRGWIALVIATLLAPAATRAAFAQTEGSWRVYLYGNEFREIVADGEDIYAATTGGVVRYSPGRGFRQWTRGPLGVSSDTLRTVAKAPDGELWFGTATAGISVFDPSSEQFRGFTSLLEPIPGDRVRKVRFELEGSTTRLLIGAEQGFSVLENAELRFVCLEGVDLCGLPSYDVHDLLSTDEGVWLATGAGVALRQPSGSFENRSNGLTAGAVSSLALSDSLYCHNADGVFRWTGSRWTQAMQGIPERVTVNALFAEPGSLHAATSDGVYRRSSGSWTRLGASFPAFCLARTASGKLFAGAVDPSEAKDGLWEWTGTEWSRHRLDGPGYRQSYRSILFTPDGDLWLSHAANQTVPRLVNYDGEAWTFYDGGSQGRQNAWTWKTALLGGDLYLAHCCCNDEAGCRLERVRGDNGRFENLAAIANPWDLETDATGALWVGSFAEGTAPARGVYRLAPDSTVLNVNVTTAQAQLRSNQVRAIRVRGQNVWIGYETNGVSRWDLGIDRTPLTADDVWTHYDATTAKRLIGSQVRRIEIGPDGRVWIGTTAGLSIWNGNDFTNIGPGFGRLPADEVSAILPLTDGGAWVSTKDAGVTRLTPRAQGGFTYQTFAAPLLPHPQVSAMTLAPDGRTVWFATLRGIAVFAPGSSTGDAAEDEVRAYPNPYQHGCSDGIRVAGAGGSVSGVVVDLAGKVLARFENKSPDDLIWDGRFEGARVAPGLYWLRLQTPHARVSVGAAVMDGTCER